MKTISLQQASLGECVKETQHQRVLLTCIGKPVALLVGAEGRSLAQIELCYSDAFWMLIREPRAQRTMTRAELESRLAEQ